MNHESTQWQDVLEVLRQGPITPLRAWVDLGVMRVADPIEKLRKRGYQIETRMRDFTTTRGKQVRFAEYHLISEPEDPADRQHREWEASLTRRECREIQRARDAGVD